MESGHYKPHKKTTNTAAYGNVHDTATQTTCTAVHGNCTLYSHTNLEESKKNKYIKKYSID